MNVEVRSRRGASGLGRYVFDARTGKYTLQWTSQIAGGPFNGFTGIWHLEGMFKQKS